MGTLMISGSILRATNTGPGWAKYFLDLAGEVLEIVYGVGLGVAAALRHHVVGHHVGVGDGLPAGWWRRPPLSSMKWYRFSGAFSAMVGRAPMPMSTSPSESNSTTRCCGWASARPRAKDAWPPMAGSPRGKVAVGLIAHFHPEPSAAAGYHDGIAAVLVEHLQHFLCLHHCVHYSLR